MDDKQLQIFVVFHKYLINECYNDLKFDLNKFTFFKCNEKYPAEYDKDFGYKVMFEKDLQIYNPKLQDESKPYMAVSALYHIYKNDIYKKYNYIGFMEYDLKLNPDPKLIKDFGSNYYTEFYKNDKTICDIINDICNKNNKHIIILSGRHCFKEFYNENNIINGENLYHKIIREYNSFFNTTHKIDDLKVSNPIMCDQQSFIADNETFEIIMRFVSHIIENKLVDYKGFRPSYLLARYIGVSIHLNDTETTLLSLKHLNRHEWK